MAIELRNATATNYHTFDPGDAILKSVNLAAAYFEIVAMFLKAVKSYNQDNTLLPYPEPEVATDDNQLTSTATYQIPYKKVGGVDKALTYVDSYIGWVEPTTGELTGMSLLDAVLYIVRAFDYGLQKLLPSVVINDTKGLITTNDNGSQVDVTSTLPYNAIVDATTGSLSNVATDILVFLDMQEGYPI